jgi:hypothetical protein
VLSDNQTRGFLAHTTLAVSVNGVPLGLLDQQVWTRAHNPKPKDNAHQQLPIEAKESVKWLKGLSAATDSLKTVVTVCDREADIYELFQQAHDEGQQVLVRAVRNRRVDEAVGGLFEAIAQSEVALHHTLTVQQQGQRAERQAEVEVRFIPVTLLPPKNRPVRLQSRALTHLKVQAVEVREVNAPPEGDAPLHWLLLTTLTVETPEQALQVVRFYTYRWRVERFHYTLKSGGCHFEDSQRRLAVCSEVAWRLLGLTYQARQTPDAPCTVALTKAEWQALTAFVQRTPTPAEQPPTLAEAVRAIAKLGGFLGRKRDGQPGVKVLWRGWLRLQDIVATWVIFHPPENVGNL